LPPIPRFFNHQYTDVLTNASMGLASVSPLLTWPSGGPSPPLAAVGARTAPGMSAIISPPWRDLRRQAGQDPGPVNAQQRRPLWHQFSRETIQPLVLGRFNIPGTARRAIPISAGSFKPRGAWRNVGPFKLILRFASNGVSLARRAREQRQRPAILSR